LSLSLAALIDLDYLANMAKIFGKPAVVLACFLGAKLMKFLNKILLTFSLLMLPLAAHAQVANPAEAAADAVVAGDRAADSPPASDTAAPEKAASTYVPMDATTAEVVGKPTPAGLDFQEQYTDDGIYAKWINNSILLPIAVVMSLFVLALLFWVAIRFNRRVNPNPSKTTHNTMIEVVWTLVPVLILLGIAYPSLDLLARQFKPAPDDAVTVKATGYQWYWTYTYPDHGGFEVVSNMLKEADEIVEGEVARTDADGPNQLAVDNRMVVPVGVPIRLQTTAADVIHSFAVPSLWYKLDAVPGRLNEKALTINKAGVYFGQCSELCGARHGYMPIAVEALPQAEFAEWVKSQGGKMPAELAAEEKAAADKAAEDKAAREAAEEKSEEAAPAAAAE